MKNMTVKEIMVRNPVLISPDTTLQEAAAKMRDTDCGVLPVGTKNNIEGVITDRDIVIRALASGKNPAKERVADYMTANALYCNEADTVKQAAAYMKKNNVGRLLVRSSGGEMSGLLSFGCILRKDTNADEVAEIITGIKGQKAA